MALASKCAVTSYPLLGSMFARYQAYRHDSQKALLGFFFLAKNL